MKVIRNWFILFMFNIIISINAQYNLQSRPDAPNVLYINTIGYNDGSTIFEQASMSSQEIIDLWRAVSENYSMFNVNITTDTSIYAATPWNKKSQILCTPTTANGTCGWSYVGVFGNPAYYSVAYCYTGGWGWNSVSHEFGHTNGLGHQASFDSNNCSNVTSSYNFGCSYGEYTFSPIMGATSSEMMRFSNGYDPCTGCTQGQNDITILNNLFGTVPDGVGDTEAEATILYFNAPSCFNGCSTNLFSSTYEGEINYKGLGIFDIDYYKISITQNVTKNIRVMLYENNLTKVGNVNLILKVYKEGTSSTWISGTGREVDSLNYNFVPGTYYIAVSIEPYAINSIPRYTPIDGQLGKYRLLF